MLFKFLKYLQPTHYFGLKLNNGNLIFPKLKDTVATRYIDDENYKTSLAKEYDKSWRALHSGYINYTDCIHNAEDVTVFDNYVFARKYFSKAWVYYTFAIRLLSFVNPIKECRALLLSRHVKRYTIANDLLDYKDYEGFKSQLVSETPMVSVIIPTLNRYRYLKDVLQDLELQDYTNFEVIIVDQSEPFQSDFYDAFNLAINVTYQSEKALWLARNTAIKASKGDYILLFDDDSRVESDWIRQHLRCLDYFQATISSGVSISKVGDKIPEHYAYFKISDQLDTGNVLLKKSIFKTIGLFDRQFEKQRMGDGEFGLRSHLYGFKNVSNPYAKRLHLKVNSGGLRDMGSWDAFRTENLFQPRPIPSVLYFFRRYYGKKRALLSILRTVPLSVIPYKYKGNKPMLLLGSAIAVLLLPLLLYQVIKSWRLSSRKLAEGPKIEFLK